MQKTPNIIDSEDELIKQQKILPIIYKSCVKNTGLELLANI